MANSPQETFQKECNTVIVSPHVAASIIEHGKRRNFAWGFLLGAKTVDSIQVSNFFPFTCTEKFTHSAFAAAYDKVRVFMSDVIIVGWYSSCCTKRLDGSDIVDNLTMVKLPSALFMGNEKDGDVGRFALHLHCELPFFNTKERELTPRPQISWSAHFALIKRTVVMSESNTPMTLPSVINTRELKVSISANGHEATNVVLSHVKNQVFYNGAKPYPSSSVLNLDALVMHPPSKRLTDAESLLSVHQQLLDMVEGRAQPTGSSGAAASENKAEIEDLRKEIHQLMENENSYSTSRDDVITHRLKDALMIKCLVTLVKKSVTQIDILSSQYPDANTGHSNPNYHSGHANGPQWRDQQPRSGPNFREVGGLMNRAEKP